MYQCVSVAHIRPEKMDEVLEAARILAEATRKQKGNISYHGFVPEGKQDVVVLAEQWETEADFQAHIAHPDVEGDPLCAFNRVIEPASAAPPELYFGTTKA